MECGWLWLWCSRWSRRHHSRLRLRSPVVGRHLWCCRCIRVQLCNQTQVSHWCRRCPRYLCRPWHWWYCWQLAHVPPSQVSVLIFSGLFAANYIAALDGVTVIPGGWLNQNWIQLAYQLCDCVTGFSYSFGVTCIILFTMNLIPGLSLRASEEAEIEGIDEAEIGEFAYDFVEKERDYVHGAEGIDGAVASSSS